MARARGIFLEHMATHTLTIVVAMVRVQPSSASTASPSTAPTASPHTTTPAIAPMVSSSSLVHASPSTAACLVLGLLFLDDVDNLVGHSQVFYLASRQPPLRYLNLVHLLCFLAHISRVIL